jgi:hypothetical protein
MGQEVIRRIYRPVVEQGIWGVRTGKELGEIYKYLDMVADIKKKSFEWMRHVVRMDQGRRVKEVFESKAVGSRSVRPRVRWLEDV